MPTPFQDLLQELLDQVEVALETLVQEPELQIKEAMAEPDQ
jgi:hypothetical protein